jgi:galactose-1-phosphate uridylyltransferase
MWRLLVRSLKDINRSSGAIKLSNCLKQSTAAKIKKIQNFIINNTVQTEAGSLLIGILRSAYCFKQTARLGFMAFKQLSASALFMTALR